jgi:hypothetical protein
MAAEIGEAADRNWTRWRIGNRNFSVPVNQLRNWLEIRLDWIDSQFIEPPALSHPGGEVPEGFELTISAPEGEIYYTVNGPDPRGGDGEPAPEAVLYAEPIRITENARIQARVRIGGSVWSESVEGGYFTHLLPLVVTEIMYNPPSDPDNGFGGTDMEFIEVKNVGEEAVDLTGVEFINRIRFDFSESAVTTLAPGAYVVVAKNLDAFTSRYGDGLPVAGVYGGTMSNTAMTVNLVGAAGEPLMEFTYRDSWHPSTDGDGHSMVIRDPTAPRESWNLPESWEPSSQLLGSPGRGEDVPAGRQLPGDFNQDGRLTVSDAVGILRHLLLGADRPPCAVPEGNLMLLDLNDDRAVGVADAVHLLGYLFAGGEPPAAGTDCVPMAGCPDLCRP